MCKTLRLKQKLHVIPNRCVVRRAVDFVSRVRDGPLAPTRQATTSRPGRAEADQCAKHHVELFLSAKMTIISSIDEACQSYVIPFISLNLDLVKSKTSNEKYMALRICFNTARKLNIGFNLAVRRFAPSTDERMADRLSDILEQWAAGVLSEFNIDINRDVLTSVSDSDSDVKRSLQVVMNPWWEWCVSHLSHLVLTDAFGTSIDPSSSKNEESRLFFKGIKKVIESINKSEYWHSAFEAETIDRFKQYLKLLNAPQHRWSATALVLECMLLCWDAVKLPYLNCKRSFPLTDEDRVQCLEFYSIIEPVRAVQILAQSTKTFVIIDVYVGLFNLYNTVLNVDKPLELIVPTRVQLGDAGQANDNEQRRHTDLHEATHTARAQAREAFSERFFDRYHPIRALKDPTKIYTTRQSRPHLARSVLTATDFMFSYLLDAQTILFPAMTSGDIIKQLINATIIEQYEVPRGWTVDELRKQHLRFIMTLIWDKIKVLAEIVAQQIVVSEERQAGNTPVRPAPQKFQKLSTMSVPTSALKLTIVVLQHLPQIV